VPRGARAGPILWLLTVQYFVVQVIVAAAWAHPYSVSGNAISDLGNTRCGTFGGRAVCSPLHVAMNASFVVLGLTMLGGAWLIARRAGHARVGLGLLGIAGAGTVLVGLFPENTSAALHRGGAALPFLLGNLGVLLLGIAGGPARRLAVAAGAVGLIGLPLFLGHRYLGLGYGGMERVTAYPQDLWLIVAGAALLRKSTTRS
jgi:hypothetical membrane protein